VDKATGKAVHRNVAGEPLPLRLVVSEVRGGQTGEVLARWLLLRRWLADRPLEDLYERARPYGLEEFRRDFTAFRDAYFSGRNAARI